MSESSPTGGPDVASKGIRHGELTVDERVGHYIDLYKQTVEVQMHFNDIEWRIRGLALTVATFALGAAGITAKDGTRIGWLSQGAVVLMIGLLLWYAFYFVDRVWYHPLLKGAVEQGTEIEQEIQKYLPHAGMTATITARSKYPTKRLVRRVSSNKTVMQSDDKLKRFYAIGATALVVAAIALQIGALLSPPPATKPIGTGLTPATSVDSTPTPDNPLSGTPD